MNYVILTNYTDSRDEVIYVGNHLWAGLQMLCKHHCMNYRIQKWEDGKLTEEISK